MQSPEESPEVLNKFLERPQILPKCTTSFLTMAVCTSFLKHPNSLFPLLIMSVSFLLKYGSKVHFLRVNQNDTSSSGLLSQFSWSVSPPFVSERTSLIKKVRLNHNYVLACHARLKCVNIVIFISSALSLVPGA